MGIKKIVILVVGLLFFFPSDNAFAQEFPVSVTVGSTSKPISPFIWGVDYNGYYHYTTADEFLAPFGDLTRLKNLGITMLRYPGGCPSDVYNWKTNEMKGRAFGTDTKFLSVDELLKLTGTLQAEPLYTININYKIVGNPCGDVPEYPGLSPDQNKQQLIQDAVDLVRAYKGRIKYFELGNEQNLTGYTPAEYQSIALPIAHAMKSVDPTIQIGLISFFDYSTNHSQPDSWSNMVKSIVNSVCGNVSCFDYVSTHDYFGVAYGTTIVPYAPLLKHQYGFANATQDFAPKKIGMTEWNTGNCWEAKAGPHSVFWGMFYQEMLLTMAEKGVFLANYHSITADGGCSLIQSSNANRSSEQVFSLSSVLAGGQILNTSVVGAVQNISYNSVSTNVPYLTAHAGYSADGTTLYVFILNHHQTLSSSISLDLGAAVNYTQGTIQVDKLSASSLTDIAFTHSTETMGAVNPLVVTVPSNSIIRLTVVKPGKIQGCKVYSGKGCYDSANDPFTLSGAPISLSGTGATNLGNNAPNSYKFDAVSGSSTVAATAPPGYIVTGYTLCYNRTDCHQNTPTPGSSATVNVPAGGYADLWWHFSPHLPGDFTDTDDIEGDQVNLADYLVFKSGFGTTYTIFDYNSLVANFGQ